MTLSSLSRVPRSLPESTGISTRSLLQFTRSFEQAGYRLNSLALYRDNSVIGETWWWPSSPEIPHMLHSATKSFTGTAAGFAIAEGMLQLDDRVIDVLHDKVPARAPDKLAALTVADLLTMRTGHDAGISGATSRLERGDLIERFLSEPISHEPGTTFTYSSATSHILSAVVQRRVGQNIGEYLKPRLFDPLDFGEYSWSKDSEGISTGGNGLMLRSEDFLKFGALYLNDGLWEGQQLLPAGWVHEASRPHVLDATDSSWDGKRFVRIESAADEPGEGYGYHFSVRPNGIYYAGGIFGQYCFIIPEHRMVIAMTGSIGEWKHRSLPHHLDTHLEDLLAHSPDAAPAAARDELHAYQLNAARPRPIVNATGGSDLGDLAGDYLAAPNGQGLIQLGIRASGENGCELTIRDTRGNHVIRCGWAEWVSNRTSIGGSDLHHSYELENALVYASIHRTGVGSVAIELVFPETPFRDRIQLEQSATSVLITRSTEVNTGSLSWPEIEAGRHTTDTARG